MARTRLAWFHPRGRERSRLASWIAGACALGVAGAYFACAYAVVFVLRIGPTTMTLDAAQGWGVHTGDALALPLACMGLLSLAFAVSCLAPQPRLPLVVRPRAVRR